METPPQGVEGKINRTARCNKRYISCGLNIFCHKCSPITPKVVSYSYKTPHDFRLKKSDQESGYVVTISHYKRLEVTFYS